MNLPDQPATFRTPSADQPWHWRLEDAAGATVALSGSDATDFAEQSFPTQGDAESWIGEVYGDLSDLGVAQVTLFEVDREVYGPMSLSA